MFKKPASPSPRNVTAVELMSRRYDIWGLPVFGPADDSLSWVAGKKTRAEHSSWWSEETRQVPSQGMPNNDHRVALTVDFS
jgi:hypothetical protein